MSSVHENKNGFKDGCIDFTAGSLGKSGNNLIYLLHANICSSVKNLLYEKFKYRAFIKKKFYVCCFKHLFEIRIIWLLS